jgi:hypothetical protein
LEKKDWPLSGSRVRLLRGNQGIENVTENLGGFALRVRAPAVGSWVPSITAARALGNLTRLIALYHRLSLLDD